MNTIRPSRRFALHSFACAVALLVVVPFAAHAYTNVSVRVNIGDAPPAPYYRIYAPPRQVYVANSVYLVEAPVFGDDDCFRYGGYYWVFRDGYWYRATSLRSRFVVVSPRYVPTAIYNVPSRHWHHHAVYSGRTYSSSYSDRRGGSYYDGGRRHDDYRGGERENYGGGRGNGHGNNGHGNNGHGNGKGKGHGKGHGGHED